jgi:hypothetical protein
VGHKEGSYILTGTQIVERTADATSQALVQKDVEPAPAKKVVPVAKTVVPAPAAKPAPKPAAKPAPARSNTKPAQETGA